MKHKIYNPIQHADALERFFAESDVENSMSLDSLGYNKRPNSMMVLTMDGDDIASLCYVHDFSEYYPKTYRAFTRTTTLSRYRGIGVPAQRNCASAAGINAHTAPFQVDYAHLSGADHVLFTTNASGGMASSQRLDHYLRLIEPQDPRFSYWDEGEIYGVRQTVWRLNFRDIVNMRGPI